MFFSRQFIPPQQQQQQQQHFCPPQQQQQQQQKVAPQISPTGLPMNWDMGVDPQSGKTFYINKSQGRTYWTLPQDVLALIIVNE